MNKIGRKIFFEIATGNIIIDTGERQGSVIETTIEQDIASYTVLSERNRETFDVIKLPFGVYAQDFSICNGYRINVETKHLEFSYPDPNEPEEQPVYVKPLGVEVEELQYAQKTEDQKYTELDKVVTSLSDLKMYKMAQLDELCSLSIATGFVHTIGDTEYLFSCSLSAQSNFQGTDALFKDGFITQAEWTVTSIATGIVGRVILDQATFNSVKLKVFQHINSNISKFRNTLQPLVESATTNEEVDAVKW